MKQNQSQKSRDQEPAAARNDAVFAATSLEIAAKLRKRHHHVLRAIRSAIAKCPEETARENFVLSSYADSRGRPRPMFCLTRAGLSFFASRYAKGRLIAHPGSTDQAGGNEAARAGGAGKSAGRSGAFSIPDGAAETRNGKIVISSLKIAEIFSKRA